jgi:energy-coupling factor transporter ATP-binding protein EcfA2
MLKQVDIEGFRLCKAVHIESLGPIVALVGRNGAGKSNILQAIAQTARIATSAEVTNPQDLMQSRHPGSVTLEFVTDDSVEYKFKRTTTIKRGAQGAIAPIILEELSYKENEAWISILRRNAGIIEFGDKSRSLQIGDMTPSLPAIATLLPANDAVVQKIAPARNFLSRIRYYSIDEPTDRGPGDQLISHQEYAAWLAAYQSSGNAGESVLMRILHWSLRASKNSHCRA